MTTSTATLSHLALQVECERVPTRAIEPVRHAVRLQSLEPLEVEQAVVVRIARGVTLAAGVATPTGNEREEVRAPSVSGEERAW